VHALDRTHQKAWKIQRRRPKFPLWLHSYANEELTAELGASFIMAEIGSELQIENLRPIFSHG